MSDNMPTVGWIGAGRMGYQLAKRLLDAGYDVAVYNRTRAKAEPLTEFGATVVDRPIELVVDDDGMVAAAFISDREATAMMRLSRSSG